MGIAVARTPSMSSLPTTQPDSPTPSDDGGAASPRSPGFSPAFRGGYGSSFHLVNSSGAPRLRRGFMRGGQFSAANSMRRPGSARSTGSVGRSPLSLASVVNVEGVGMTATSTPTRKALQRSDGQQSQPASAASHGLRVVTDAKSTPSRNASVRRGSTTRSVLFGRQLSGLGGSSNSLMSAVAESSPLSRRGSVRSLGSETQLTRKSTLAFVLTAPQGNSFGAVLSAGLFARRGCVWWISFVAAHVVGCSHG